MVITPLSYPEMLESKMSKEQMINYVLYTHPLNQILSIWELKNLQDRSGNSISIIQDVLFRVSKYSLERWAKLCESDPIEIPP